MEPVGNTLDSGSADGLALATPPAPAAAGSRFARSETVILPHRGLFDWRLCQLWRYRDLIVLFVWRDFVAVYKQTILGPAWHVIQPLFTTFTFTIVFSRVAHLSTDGAPPFLFYMAGNLLWNYFATCINGTSRTFLANAPLFGKVYFHRLVIPLSLVASNLIAFGIQFVIFMVALVFFRVSDPTVHFTVWAWATPIFLVMLAGYGLGAGIIVSALTTRYRDLAFLVTFGVQLAMYVTPVIYPTSAMPDRYRWIAQANPLSPLIEGFRRGFLGVGTVALQQLGLSFAIMLVVLAVGLMLFTRVEQTFMDTV
jgi:lipopolysaccharide transport system permease protein